MDKKIKFALLLVTLGANCFFSQQEKFSRVKIFADNAGLNKIAGLGVCVDHGERKYNTWLITEVSQMEITAIKKAGYQLEILIDDVVQHYESQNSSAEKNGSGLQINSTSCNDNCDAWPQPANFSLGSFAGFFTLQEVINNLDSMAAKYPSLITSRQSIGSGTTVEGRTIYYVKISDNPSADENEPEILYNSLHHAREPESISQLIYYMWYLLENYATDSTIKYLVNTTEMYFVPVVNPDGYVYNYSQNPSGGGMWRKNRKVNGDGTFGVDLNRNYGYNWGYDNFGSSPNTGTDTYRGPSANSEPETQLLENFIDAHDFRIAVNNHTYSNLLIYPFGYEANTLTPDSSQFTAYAQLMTTCNDFGYGTPNQTVGYTGNGSIDDWLYGDTSIHTKILSFTPEAGASSDGFWPAQSRIIPIAQNTMAQNLYAAKLISNFGEVKNTDGLFVSQGNIFAHFNFTRLGMEAGSFTVSIVPVSTNIISIGNPVTYSNPSLLQTTSDSIAINIAAGTFGETVSYVLAVDNGAFTEYDTINRVYGVPVVVFQDDCNAMNSQWTNSGWGVTSAQFTSAGGSFSESVSGITPDNIDRSIKTTNFIDLTDALAARLKFNAKWMIEPQYDYMEIQASTDDVTWDNLCGKYTDNGSVYQNLNNPLYDGFQSDWVAEEINLADYIGQNIKLRFHFATDGGVTYDGIYIDDVVVEKITSGSTGVQYNTNYELFSIFPNPASEEISVLQKGKGQSDFSLRIYDTEGRLIDESSTLSGKNSISYSLKNIPDGFYFLHFIQEKKITQVKKLIVHKN
jgi:carboxypeptidase T